MKEANEATINWVDVETELPDEGKNVLLLTDTGIIEGRLLGNEEGYIFDKEDREWGFLTLDAHGCGCCAGGTDKVLYWSELPSLPDSYKRVESHL